MKSTNSSQEMSTPEAIARVHEPIGKRVSKETPLRTKLFLLGAGVLSAVGVGHMVLGTDGSIDQDRYNRTGHSVSETVPTTAEKPQVTVTLPASSTTTETSIFQGPEDPKGPTSVSAFEPTGDVYQVEPGDSPWELVYTRLVDDQGHPIKGDLDPLVRDFQNQSGENEIFDPTDRIALPQHMHIAPKPYTPHTNAPPQTPVGH